MAGASRLSALQLPVALAGAAVVAWAVAELATLPPPPPGGDGLPGGLAALFLYGVAWVGFVVCSVGLAIPSDGRRGVAFSRGQRRLFGAAAVAAVASAVLPVVGFGLLLAAVGADVAWLAVLGWLVPAAVAVLALLAGLGWRAAEALSVGPFG